MLTFLKPRSVLLLAVLGLLIICLAIDLPRNYPEHEHTATMIFLVTTTGTSLLFIPFYLVLAFTKRMLKYPKDFDLLNYFQIALGSWGALYICILLTDIFRTPPLNFNNTVTFLVTTLMASVIWLPVAIFKLWQHRSNSEFSTETEFIHSPEIAPQASFQEELLIDPELKQRPQVIQKSICPPIINEQPASPNPWDSQLPPSVPRSNSRLDPELNIGPLINDEQTLFISYACLNNSNITDNSHQLVLTNRRLIFIEDSQNKQFYLSEIIRHNKTEQALELETNHGDYTFYLEHSQLNEVYKLLHKMLYPPSSPNKR